MTPATVHKNARKYAYGLIYVLRCIPFSLPGIQDLLQPFSLPRQFSIFPRVLLSRLERQHLSLSGDKYMRNKRGIRNDRENSYRTDCIWQMAEVGAWRVRPQMPLRFLVMLSSAVFRRFHVSLRWVRCESFLSPLPFNCVNASRSTGNDPNTAASRPTESLARCGYGGPTSRRQLKPVQIGGNPTVVWAGNLVEAECA